MRKLPFFFRYSYPKTKHSRYNLGNEIANTHTQRGQPPSKKKENPAQPIIIFIATVLFSPQSSLLLPFSPQSSLFSSKMPRPGPRPYECVRRAWHSERHQPMRGSIIQQIFRVVNDTHSSDTKKKKEWQEKLPIVVLKAEEIMYSKANSEAEYLNPDTLWDRLNDAINTIIRRDESTETGDFLPPCVEAALNLGCKPVRASRSERHNNPRTYLTPRTQEPASGSPNNVGGLRPQFSPLQSGNPLNFAKSQAAVSPLPISDSNKRAQQSNRLMMSSCNYPFSDTFPAAPRQPPPLTMETNPSLNLGSVYPVYYGTQYQSKEPRLRPTPENTSSDKIFVGTPIITPIPEPAGIGLLQSHSYSRSQQVFHSTAKETAVEIQENPYDRECDLSLRLGLSSHPCSSRDKSSACETEDGGSVSLRGYQEGNKFSHLSLQMNRDCCFYPRETGFEPFDCSSTRCNNLEDEHHQNLREATFRKRKAPLGTSNEEDGHFCRQLGVPSNRFSDRSRGPGL